MKFLEQFFSIIGSLMPMIAGAVFYYCEYFLIGGIMLAIGILSFCGTLCLIGDENE